MRSLVPLLRCRDIELEQTKDVSVRVGDGVQHLLLPVPDGATETDVRVDSLQVVPKAGLADAEFLLKLRDGEHFSPLLTISPKLGTKSRCETGSMLMAQTICSSMYAAISVKSLS